MDNSTFLKEARNLLRGVIRQRRFLLSNGDGYIESDYAKTEMNNIENALSRITDAAKMQQYLQRKETVINYLVPTTNPKRKEKLRELISHQFTNAWRPSRNYEYTC